MLFHFLQHYRYAVLFLGVFLGGDTALLAGLFLAIIGAMTLPYVVLVTLFASLLGDAVWYGVGLMISYKTLKKLPYFRTHTHHIEALEHFLDRHAVKTLFYSKFVYGSRTLIQILCGTHELDLIEYFSVNVIGTSLWIAVMVALTDIIHTRAHSFKHLAHGIELGFTVLIVLIIVMHILIQKFFINKIDKGEIK